MGSSRYLLLDTDMKYTGNPDYYASGLPRQIAQYVLEQACCQRYENILFSLPGITQEPVLACWKAALYGYRRKGENTTVLVFNQDCVIRVYGGSWYVGLPIARIRWCESGIPSHMLG